MKIMIVQSITPELQDQLMEDEDLTIINAEQLQTKQTQLTDDITYIVLAQDGGDFQYVVGDKIHIIGDTFETTEINGMLGPYVTIS